jgi:hypothetical protein
MGALSLHMLQCDATSMAERLDRTCCNRLHRIAAEGGVGQMVHQTGARRGRYMDNERRPGSCLIGVQKLLAGTSNLVISQSMTREMLKKQSGFSGLGSTSVGNRCASATTGRTLGTKPSPLLLQRLVRGSDSHQRQR